MGSEHQGQLSSTGMPDDAFGASFAAHSGVTAQNAFVSASRERMSPRTPVPLVHPQNLGPMPSSVPALPGGFPTSAARGPRVEELLMEQNRLLLGLLQTQQAAVQSQQASSSTMAPVSKPFVDPKLILEDVDPEIRAVFQEFEVETRNLFAAWATQKAMQHKYERLKQENSLHPHFEAEAKHQWQFTKLYLAHAQPVASESTDMNDGYDLKAVWSSMRRRHAKECFGFVCLHQEKCLEMYDSLVKLPVLLQKLKDRLDSWFAQHGYDDPTVKTTLHSKAALFVESLLRSEFPKAQSRVEKEKELRAKRDKAILEASEKWQSMEVKDVLSPALFELAKLGGARKPVKLKNDSALAYLVHDNPELCQKYNVKIAAPVVEPPGKSKASTKAKPKRPGTPKPRGRSRDGSGSRSSPAPRPPSILKSERRSSRGSSRTSSNGRSKSVRFTKTGDRKGGKGSSKGKTKSKSKGKRK